MHARLLLPYIIVAILFGGVAIDYWLTINRTNDSPSPKRLKLHSLFIALAVIGQAWLLWQDIFSWGLNLTVANASATIVWLTVLIYCLFNVKYHVHSLQAFVLPPAALMVLLQGWSLQTHWLQYEHQSLFILHICIAFLAYSLFTFSALHALLMATAERNLHLRQSVIKLPDFPPLMIMENMLFKMVAVGFILLSVTLITGMMFSEQIFQQPLRFNHKNVFTILSWLIYAALLIGRVRYGWRGRTAIRWTLWGFLSLLLAYLGSKFVLEILLNR